MKFAAQGMPLDQAGFSRVQEMIRTDSAALWAVLSVETRGFGFLPDRRPQILFERHIFQRCSNGVFSADYPDISASTPGGYSGGVGEYSRLERAMALNREAALKSVSWGIAQIMGFNFELAGFATVEELALAMVESENRQMLAMANFIKGNHLDQALIAHNWPSFARGYNGSNFERNQYHTRLAAAFAHAKTAPPDLALRGAQAALLYLGIDPGPIDGLRGHRTTAGIMLFQTTNNLPASGQLDSETQSALCLAAFP